MSIINWDPQLTKWGVQKVERQGAKWRLVSARVLDNTAMGQARVIRIVTLGESGDREAGVMVKSDWEGRDPRDEPPVPQPTEGYPGEKFGVREYVMTGVIRLDKDGKLQSRGNHFCWVEDRDNSDEVNGLGLVNGQATNFEVVFQRQPAPKPPAKK